MLSYTPEVVAQQRRCYEAVKERIARFTKAERDETREPEAVLIVFALMNVARELLNGYPERERAMLMDQIVAPFLMNERPAGEASELIRSVGQGKTGGKGRIILPH